MKTACLLLLLLVIGCSPDNRSSTNDAQRPDTPILQDPVHLDGNPSKALEIIAERIRALGDTYSQLKDFSLESHLDKKAIKIVYEFRTNKAQHAGGWTSGVPNPDPDGIWFYIDFHNASSTAQVHTQPAEIASYYLGDKKLQFLILEGSKTKSVREELWKIIEAVGVKEQQKPRIEQGGADQPATAPEVKSEGKESTNPEAEVRPK